MVQLKVTFLSATWLPQSQIFATSKGRAPISNYKNSKILAEIFCQNVLTSSGKGGHLSSKKLLNKVKVQSYQYYVNL